MRQTLHFPPYIMLSLLWAFCTKVREDMIQELGDRGNFLPKEVNCLKGFPTHPLKRKLTILI
jgi:hypothetical protein